MPYTEANCHLETTDLWSFAPVWETQGARNVCAPDWSSPLT